MSDFNQIIQRGTMRRTAMERMTADLRWLVARPENSLTWTASQRDLVEMVHLVWAQRVVTDEQGMLYSRNQLAQRAFAVVGRAMPNSLSHIVYELQNRLDHSRSMLVRYENLIAQDDRQPIIHHFITEKTS